MIIDGTFHVVVTQEKAPEPPEAQPLEIAGPPAGFQVSSSTAIYVSSVVTPLYAWWDHAQQVVVPANPDRYGTVAIPANAITGWADVTGTEMRLHVKDSRGTVVSRSYTRLVT